MTNNRFKKAVENATDNTLDSIISNAVEDVVDTAFEETSSTYGNLIKRISQNNKRDRGINRTIYLPSDVDIRLTKLSNETGKNRSSIIADILREILL